MGLVQSALNKLRKEQNKLIKKKGDILAKMQKLKVDSEVISNKINDINIKMIKMQKENDVVLMAIGDNAVITKESGDSVARQLFTGVVPVKVLAVNPNKKRLEEIYGREFDKEPEYISADENNVKKVRIDFIVQTVPNDKLGVDIEEISKVSYFLEEKFRTSSGGKFQVVNSYGEFSWGTQDEIKAGKLAANLAFYPTKGMRPAYVGEEDLTNFVRTLLGIPGRQTWDNNAKAFVDIKDIATSEGNLENIKKYFTGDISEITNVVKTFVDNKVKLIAGVKTTDENKQYQAFATKYPIFYSNSNKYAYYYKRLKETIDAGGYSNIDFGSDDLQFRLYKNTPTSFENKVNDDPFDTAMNTGVPANSPVDTNWFD